MGSFSLGLRILRIAVSIDLAQVRNYEHNKEIIIGMIYIQNTNYSYWRINQNMGYVQFLRVTYEDTERLVSLWVWSGSLQVVLSFREDKGVHCLDLLPFCKGALSDEICLRDDGVFKAGQCRELCSPYLNPRVLVPFFPFKGYDGLVVESSGKRFDILLRFTIDGRQGSTLRCIEPEPCPVGEVFDAADHLVDVILGVGGYTEVI